MLPIDEVALPNSHSTQVAEASSSPRFDPCGHLAQVPPAPIDASPGIHGMQVVLPVLLFVPSPNGQRLQAVSFISLVKSLMPHCLQELCFFAGLNCPGTHG
mgnify:CR=1 FL=1